VSDVRQVLEEFRLHKVLKTSAQSTVFEASEPSTGDAVVLKLINPATAITDIQTTSRFDVFAGAVRERRPVGVPPVLGFGLTPEHGAFLVLEPVAGEPVSSLQDRSLARRLSIALEVLGVIERLGGAGVVHGNLAPDNVLVSSHGIGDRVVLVGLGTCAYLLGVRPEVWPMGSSNWAVLPPELERGVAEPETDLWSVARVTCDLLRLPLVDADGARPRPTVPDALADVVGEPEVLADVLAGALLREVADRRVTASDLRDALIRAMPTDPTAELPEIDAAALVEAGVWDRTVRLPVPQPTEPPEIPDADDEPMPGGAETVRLDVAGIPPTADDLLVSPDTPADDDVYATTVRMPITEAMPVVGVGPDGSADGGSETVLASPEPAAVEPTPPPVPEPVPEPVPPAPRDPGAAASGRRSLWLPLAVIAGMLAVAGGLAIGVRLLGPDTAVEPTPLPVATPMPVPPPTPVEEARPVVHPLLEVAQELLLDGDVDGARETVALLDDERIAAFTEAEREIWGELQAGFTGADIDASVVELRQGLALGSIPMLRRSVSRLSSVSDETLEANPGLGADLEHARRALRLHSAMWKASDEGDHLTVLETARDLIAELPDYSGAPSKREQAATELETRAEALIAERDYAGAVRVLESLRTRWPERAGVTERIAWCRSRMETEQEFRQLLDRAESTARGGDPEGALEMLEGVQAPPALQGRLQQVRTGIRGELDRIDAGYPTVEIPADFELAYRKDRPLTVPIRIADDYRVERAVVLVRTESNPEFREIVLRDSGDGVYPFHVGPDVHGNETVEFYVVATDRSGHETRVGGPEGPLTIERKRWYQR
jgi:serine/threonine protein kinase